MMKSVAQCFAFIAQHPPCHVWPAFRAVEHSSTQSWSPLDAGQLVPGLGGMEGEREDKVNNGVSYVAGESE